MGKVFTMVGSGGGGSAVVIVTAPTGSTVTMTKGTDTKTATEVSGTWAFTFASAEFGSWNINASLSGKSKTEPLLIDTATVYTVPIDFNLWLYKDGDECEDVTGGWDLSNYLFQDWQTGYAKITATKESQYMQSNLAYNQYSVYGTNNKINFSDYNYVKMVVECNALTERNVCRPCITTQKNYSVANEIVAIEYSFTSTSEVTVALYIGGVTSTNYFALPLFAKGNVSYKVKRIWLE